jgi:hypothetical protein
MRDSFRRFLTALVGALARGLIWDFLALSGFAFVLTGLAFVDWRLAAVVGGLALLVLGFVGAKVWARPVRRQSDD